MKDQCVIQFGQIQEVKALIIVDVTGWTQSSRGAGFIFGKDVVEKFNHSNGIDLICRSHQLVQAGYQ